MNAIHALSQLSYAPITRASKQHFPWPGQREKVSRRARGVKQKQPLCARWRGPVIVLPMPFLSASQPPDRGPRQPVTTPFAADASLAEILGTPPPPRRVRKRETSHSLGASGADRDILDQYLHEVSRTPLLTQPQEIAVARRVRAGDELAMQELVQRNLRFVISVAKKYQNRGMALIDLIGEGNVGLMTAARKFDPEQGVKFISYAVWWIRQSILAALARHGRTVRVPLNRTADLSRIIRASESLRQDLGREATPEELSKATGLAVDVVQSLASLNTAEVRLDAPLSPDGDRALVDRFIAEGASDTETAVMERFLVEAVERALRLLAPRDARVIQLYFGLDGGREHTLEEIGAMLGVTRERVRQLRDRALKRLRDGDAGEALRSFAA